MSFALTGSATNSGTGASATCTSPSTGDFGVAILVVENWNGSGGVDISGPGTTTGSAFTLGGVQYFVAIASGESAPNYDFLIGLTRDWMVVYKTYSLGAGFATPGDFGSQSDPEASDPIAVEPTAWGPVEENNRLVAMALFDQDGAPSFVVASGDGALEGSGTTLTVGGLGHLYVESLHLTSVEDDTTTNVNVTANADAVLVWQLVGMDMVVQTTIDADFGFPYERRGLSAKDLPYQIDTGLLRDLFQELLGG